MNIYHPRPPTCINRNEYPICCRQIIGQRLDPMNAPDSPCMPFQLPEDTGQFDRPILPFGLGRKKR